MRKISQPLCGIISPLRKCSTAVIPPAPTASGTSPEDQSLSTGEGGGETTFDCSPWFSGVQIVYSLISPPLGCVINAATGIVTVSTLAVLALTNLVIRATNPGGYFEITIQIEVTL